MSIFNIEFTKRWLLGITLGTCALLAGYTPAEAGNELTKRASVHKAAKPTKVLPAKKQASNSMQISPFSAQVMRTLNIYNWLYPVSKQGGC